MASADICSSATSPAVYAAIAVDRVVPGLAAVPFGPDDLDRVEDGPPALMEADWPSDR